VGNLLDGDKKTEKKVLQKYTREKIFATRSSTSSNSAALVITAHIF